MLLPSNQLDVKLENGLGKVPTSDKLYFVKPPARLLLAVLTLTVGAFSPIVPSQATLAISETSDCCATMNTGTCHGCPMPIGPTTSMSGSSCCATQSSCCVLLLTKSAEFSATIQFLGVISENEQRATTRTQRPPVPPPRVLFS